MAHRSLPARILARLRPASLSAAVRAERDRDRKGLPGVDPGSAFVVEAALDWLCRAQDRSKSGDGGVARDYSLVKGWASSYPETTGYIIPTFLAAPQRGEPRDLRERARRMLDWLVSIQLPGGGFQAGKADATPVIPVTFNTGQVVLGLAAGQVAFGSYAEPLQRAADWLVQTQDPDGAWRKHPTPFAVAGEKSYETHVAWGLLEAARVFPDRGYDEAAFANLRWAVGNQRPNGWIANCCLSNPSQPLSHTLGYALRGWIEGIRFRRDERLLEAACRTADGLASALRSDGFLPGTLRADWSPGATWTCLTGTLQIATCWLLLYLETGVARYRDLAFTANAFVRRTVRLDGPDETRGGVKGSFPVDGAYGQYQYVNWAAKFLIDSLLLEERVRRDSAATS